MKRNAKILVIEDDPSAATIVRTALSMIELDLDIIEVRTSLDAMEILEGTSGRDISLIVLDIDLETKGAGLAVLYASRSIPTIVITGRETKMFDEPLVLLVGAANFFTKPLDTKKFIVTARNLLRLTGAFRPVFEFPNGLIYDSGTGIISLDQEVLTNLGDVSKLAFDLLASQYPDEVLTEKLLEYVYGDPKEDRELLYTLMRRLRKVLEKHHIPLEIDTRFKGRIGGTYKLTAV